MEELNVPHFRNLLSRNIENLKNSCQKWEEENRDSSLPEDVHDEIRTTIGLTTLLMNQKLKQFQGLIDDSEFKRGEKEITCVDLQGISKIKKKKVEKIQKSFQRLERCKENQWIFVQEEMPKIETKKKLPTIAKTIVSSKKHASAARQRLAEAKLKMKMAMQNEATAKATNNDGASTEKAESKKVIKEENVEETNRPANVISNITNKQKSLPKGAKGKTQKTKKIIHNTEKENLCSLLTDSNPPAKKIKGKPKDFIPLACVTRSAKRAMLERQGHKAE